MVTLKATTDVQGLLSFIRDFIQHPRRLDPLLRDEPGWNMLASAMDVVSDTESAITSYENGEYSDTGTMYLVLYGLFQAMYVQQDGLENMVRALEGSDQYKIGNEPEADLIRRVRHDAVGHPTKQGGTKQRKDGQRGEQLSHGIVQCTMHKEGFTLLRTSNLSDPQFIEYSTELLIEQNRALAVRVLARIKERLEKIEMEHRENFKGERLVEFFPSQLGYHFEKLHAAIRDPTNTRDPRGAASLNSILKAFEGFKGALTKRGILNRSSDIQYFLEEVEYPLIELDQYLKGQGTLTDHRAATIFADFTHRKIKELLQIAVEIDAEYDASSPVAEAGLVDNQQETIGRVGQGRQAIISRDLFERFHLREGDVVEFSQSSGGALMKPKSPVQPDDK